MIQRGIALIGLIVMAMPGMAAAGGAALPLGDGQLANTPERGKIMACPRGWFEWLFVGGGAGRDGPWIRDGQWYPDEKPQVSGGVDWPDADLSISVEGAERVIRTVALPSHPTGVYPIEPGTRAFEFDRNPNSIRKGEVRVRLPLAPRFAAQSSCAGGGPVGIALTGAPIFNGLDAGQRDAAAHELQDNCNGHPQQQGQYHYHNWSPCLLKKGVAADRPVGWMLDGFPILGPYDSDGKLIHNADLDECHGRVGEVEIDGRRVTTYHYRFTLEYPYSIGCFRGTPFELPPP